MIVSDQTPQPDAPHLEGDSLFMWVKPGQVPLYLTLGWQFCGNVVGSDSHHGYWSAAMWKPAKGSE